MKKSTRVISAAVAALLCAALLGGCGSKKTTAFATKYPDKEYGFQLDKPAAGEEIAVMHTSMGDVSIRFFPEAAPKAVKNFLTHAKEGYYDNLTFHRVMEDFMIQGGDPDGTGSGGKSIYEGGAFEDEFDAKLMNLRGALAMANSGPNTNGSQFFINQASAASMAKTINSYKNSFEVNQAAWEKQGVTSWKQAYANSLSGGYNTTFYIDTMPNKVLELYEKNGGNLHLDGSWRASGGHTVFGQVFEGMDVVDAIAAVSVDSNSKPLKAVTIKSIDVTTYAG